MWAILLELGLPALLLFALWRVWPKETDADAASTAPQDESTQDHDRQP